ncbi:hypothetical protein DPQ33_13665 [Oceanidesulfovibrio indonesiensis]|uniref:Uncharacterized protein n=1 Tax=Oceanidesulfovibrio indonesiensis TaxID=54767 RepID=A0A7M3MD43_9BACT|nr:hypothetical protein [Oceanidesulfovibrio indonesiensis]TVM16005.1 hypothetical protein DPQ33_13665 [Oceanidesulfovibrio indonesiensis]
MHRLRFLTLPVLLTLLALGLVACNDSAEVEPASSETAVQPDAGGMTPPRAPAPRRGAQDVPGEACPRDVYPDSPGAESYIVPGAAVAPRRSVTDHTLVSTKHPNGSFQISDDFVYAGTLNSFELAGARPMPIAVSKDDAQTFVFVDHEGGLVTRAVVFTFVSAVNRDCLLADTLDWVEHSLDSGIFRTPRTAMAYATAAFEQPFESAVANFLRQRNFTTSGCYLVKILTRLYAPDSLGYIFYVENTGREAGMACPEWRVAPDELSDRQQQFIAEFSANMADNVLFLE